MSEPGELRTWAEHYRRRGWAIIPSGRNKRPVRGVAWKRYQHEQPTEAQIARWSQRSDVLGWAVINGPVSGGLVCRDFDDLAAYQRWAARFAELAATLPTVATARGRHVYFLSAQDRTTKLRDGEYRGAGSYNVLPPSIHPSGVVYEWLIPLPEGDLPRIDDPAAAGLLGDGTEIAQPAESTEQAESAQAMEQGGVGVDDAIAATLPSGEGQRNDKLFELARRLKALPELADASAADLTPVLREWHKRALPRIATKAFEETRFDFARAWDNAILPWGDDPLRLIVERAEARGNPPETEQYDNPAIRHLAAICRELQRCAGLQPFFLSCRTAGKLLGVPWRTCARWLGILRMDGLLKLEKQGERAAGQADAEQPATQKRLAANRYRWLGRVS